jgi:hypothetical protein
MRQVDGADGKGEGEGEGEGVDLEIMPDIPNETAVRNQRMFVRDSCKLPPARG